MRAWVEICGYTHTNILEAVQVVCHTLFVSFSAHSSGFLSDSSPCFLSPVWLLFSPAVEKCMSSMQMGTQMVKLRGGSKGLVRFFFLDEHKSCIRWRPSRKNEKAKSKFVFPAYSLSESSMLLEFTVFVFQTHGGPLEPYVILQARAHWMFTGVL